MIKLTSRIIKEGGNVFGTTSPIAKADIEPTLEVFVDKLSKLFPTKASTFKQFEKLGSVGKKELSGDIDLAYDVKNFFPDGVNPDLEGWGLDEKKYNELVTGFAKRAINATPEKIKLRAIIALIGYKINDAYTDIEVDVKKGSGSGALFCSIQQYDTKKNPLPKYVQTDINIGNLDWLKFSYYSNTYAGNVKGLHRTQLMLSLFSNKGYIFGHGTGVIDKATRNKVANNSQEAIDLLNKIYGFNLDRDTLDDYFKLGKYLKANLTSGEYNEIIDRYLKILDSTKEADIPEDLQDYWITNQERLGLSGEKLPKDSKLIKYKKTITESGSIGADRIPSKAVKATVDSFVDKVLKKYPLYKSHKITGSYNIIPKDEDGNVVGGKEKPEGHGDIDLVVELTGDRADIKQIKADFANYLKSLSDDVTVPFKSGRHQGKKIAGTGDIVITQYTIEGFPDLTVQIDNMIVVSPEELTYRSTFLDIPGERQALLIGLAKVICIEENPYDVFKRLNITDVPQLKNNQEFEFVLSSKGLTLRVVTLDGFKELDRTDIWSSYKWSDVEKLFQNYNIDGTFKELLNDIVKKIKNPRSKNRIKGTFKSMLVINSGEVGTPKGVNKQMALDTVATLEEKYGSFIVDLIRPILEAETGKQTIAVFPGAFKPPHASHLKAIQVIAPKVDKVYVYVSKQPRVKEGQIPVDASQAMAVWELYKDKGLIPSNVEIKLAQNPTPVSDAYQEMEAHPENKYLAVFGKDQVDRWKSVEKDREKYGHVTPVNIGNLKGLSASGLRTAIKNKDLQAIETYLPKGVTVKEYIQALTKGKKLDTPSGLEEGKQVGLLYHYTSADGLKGILSSNRINASEEYYLGNDLYYISFTRNKNFHNKGSKFGVKTEYRITLDGNKFSNRYKIIPFAYKPGWNYEDNWEYDWLEDEPENVVRDFFNNTGDYDEQEERISFKSPKDGIDNIKNYILAVDKVEDLQEGRKKKADPKKGTGKKEDLTEAYKGKKTDKGAPGTFKAKITKAYGGDVTIEKAKKFKNRENATTLDKQQANWFINFHSKNEGLNEVGDSSSKPYKWELINQDDYEVNYNFVTDTDVDYNVELGIYDIEIDDDLEELHGRTALEVTFTANDKGYDGFGDANVIVNRGEVFRVMATIVDIIKVALAETGASVIIYAPAKKKDTGTQRDNLYRAFIKKEIPNVRFEQKGDTVVALLPDTQIKEVDKATPHSPGYRGLKEQLSYRNRDTFNRLQYYKNYFINVAPSTFDITTDNENIIIGGVNKPYPKDFNDVEDTIQVPVLSENTDPSNLEEKVTATEVICDKCGWTWKIADGGDDLYICHNTLPGGRVCGNNNDPDLFETPKPKAGSAIPYGSGYRAVKNNLNEDLYSVGEPADSPIQTTPSYAEVEQELRPYIIELVDFMVKQGLNVTPAPRIEFVEDEENAKVVLGRTAYYNPTNKVITLYTTRRHPKDVLRSFAHEMIHHMQNLEGRLENMSGTTNVNEDSYLANIEREAYDNGNMIFRSWENDRVGNNSIHNMKGFTPGSYDMQPITEGAYDSITRQVVKDVMAAWKEEYTGEEGTLSFDEEYETQDAKGRPLDFILSADLLVKETEEGTYKVDGGADADIQKKDDEDDPDFAYLEIRFQIDPRTLPQLWSRIYADLTDVVRHEIEHLTQMGVNVVPAKELPDDKKLRKMIDWEVLPKADYFRLQTELDPMLQGMYLKAKKTRTPFKDILNDYLDMQGVTPEDKENILELWRKRIKALSLPQF